MCPIVNKTLIEVWHETMKVKTNYTYTKKKRNSPVKKHTLKTNYVLKSKQCPLPILKTSFVLIYTLEQLFLHWYHIKNNNVSKHLNWVEKFKHFSLNLVSTLFSIKTHKNGLHILRGLILHTLIFFFSHKYKKWKAWRTLKFKEIVFEHKIQMASIVTSFNTKFHKVRIYFWKSSFTF